MTGNWQIASLGWDDSPRIDLNINRRELQRRISLRARRKGLALICVSIYAGAALIPWTASIVDLRHEAGRLSGKIHETQTQIEQLEQMSAQLDARQAAWLQYRKELRERRSWGDALATIAADCPGKVYLDQLHVDGQSRAVTVSGTCEGIEYVNGLVAALNRSGAFVHVTLSETSTDPVLAGRLRFKIEAECMLPLAGD